MLADPPLEKLDALVEGLKGAWRTGAAPDAAGALRDHPALLPHRSLVVDLAYEEYCLREEAGATPELEGFCGRFPAFRTHIRELIRDHRILAEHPELLDGTPDWPRPGDRFEQLVLVRELGRGAFARVYLARDPEAGDREVALKLSPGPSREARTLGPIRHPHVVPVLWARRSGGFDAVCMPFVSATTLADAVEAAFRPAGPRTTPGPAPPPTAQPGECGYYQWAAGVGARVAGAVAHLHSAGIAHGDLKPSNVLLGPGGHPYLIDFNLATALADAPLRCGGTLPYMPPERLRLLVGGGSEPPSVAAADVYSFGAVLFEMLTGRVPVEPVNAPDPVAVAADLLRRLTERRPARHPSAPAPLAALTERCLDPDPARRPTMAEVEAALRCYLARADRRARLLRRAAAAAVAVAAVGLGAMFVRPPDAPAGSASPPQEAPASAPPAAAPVTADEHFAEGLRHLRAGAGAAALKDFDTADRLNPSGPSAAYLAYCQSLAAQHRLASGLYARAIRGGFSPAWVRNNYARSLVQAGPTAERLRQAEREAEEALRLSPGLRAARLNHVYARYRLAVAESKKNLVDSEALAEVDAVMAEAPYTADLYYNAALMTVAFGGGRPDCCARAVGYLEKAVQLGRPPRSFPGEPLFKRHLAAREDFRHLLTLSPGTPGPATDPHLVPPALD